MLIVIMNTELLSDLVSRQRNTAGRPQTQLVSKLRPAGGPAADLHLHEAGSRERCKNQNRNISRKATRRREEMISRKLNHHKTCFRMFSSPKLLPQFSVNSPPYRAVRPIPKPCLLHSTTTTKHQEGTTKKMIKLEVNIIGQTQYSGSIYN